MRRRPGLWLTLGALAAGVVLLGAAGCGSSNSSSNAAGSGGNTSAIPPHQNGGTIKIALAGNIDYLDPALAYYQSTWQIEYSTCVKLTNYPDLPGDAGRVITPEAASALPTISADGLTYTYTVPAGKFKFNTGEPVTAATFQHALERDLNPKQASYFGAVFLAPFIKGASDYKGKPGEHVSGITVPGDQLTIHYDPEGRLDGLRSSRRRSPARSRTTRPSTRRACTRSQARGRTTSPTSRRTGRSC